MLVQDLLGGEKRPRTLERAFYESVSATMTTLSVWDNDAIKASVISLSHCQIPATQESQPNTGLAVANSKSFLSLAQDTVCVSDILVATTGRQSRKTQDRHHSGVEAKISYEESELLKTQYYQEPTMYWGLCVLALSALVFGLSKVSLTLTGIFPDTVDLRY